MHISRRLKTQGKHFVLVTGLLVVSCMLCSASVAPPVVKGELTSLGSGEDAVSVLKVWGSPYEMGYAHGSLCKERIKAFYARLLFGMAVGMQVTPQQLDDVWLQMEPFISPRHKTEMQGLADGAGLDLKTVQRAHVIPDLSEFHCTFFAAWGPATKDGHLHQIRALDYATAAGIQQEPALIVQIPDDANAFVNIGWLGFIGCVSGMNEAGIALSEIGDDFGYADETLAGEPMPLLMRRTLEEAGNLSEAVEVFRTAHRTSSYLYCIGDGKIPSAVKLRTCSNVFEVFGPTQQGDMSLENVVYWSMGCDSKWNPRVYEALKNRWGSIDENVGMYDIMRGLGTGDLHAVHYDATNLELWVANATCGAEALPAYDQEFIYFSLKKFLH